MIELYGKAHCFVQFGHASGPFQTSRAEIKAQPRGDDSIWRVRVPGYGWRKLRYPTLTERRDGLRLPYVILTGAERATISGDAT